MDSSEWEPTADTEYFRTTVHIVWQISNHENPYWACKDAELDSRSQRAKPLGGFLLLGNSVRMFAVQIWTLVKVSVFRGSELDMDFLFRYFQWSKSTQKTKFPFTSSKTRRVNYAKIFCSSELLTQSTTLSLEIDPKIDTLSKYSQMRCPFQSSLWVTAREGRPISQRAAYYILRFIQGTHNRVELVVLGMKPSF